MDRRDSKESKYPRKKSLLDEKNPDMFALMLHEGQEVDILDPKGDWYKGKILKLKHDPNKEESSFALVHYSGWGEANDEWIESASSRLSPFRSKTGRKFTGEFKFFCGFGVFL